MGRQEVNAEKKASMTATEGLNDSFRIKNTGIIKENVRLREKQSDVFQKYELIKTIGEGSISTISLVQHKGNFNNKTSPWYSGLIPSFLRKNKCTSSDAITTGKLFALKTILLRKVNHVLIQELYNEVNLLKQLDHPNIIKVHEIYNMKKQVYIVMELCTGGDLWTRAPYNEKQAARIMGQIMSAVCYMHKQHVVHRDLKLENIMFESHDRNAAIKVIDFGLSAKFIPAQSDPMTTRVGTVYTMSPQVLKKEYTSQADLWACGVIAFALLSNRLPFYARSRKLIIDKIVSGRFEFVSSIWDNISDDAKDFISCLLKYDPKERLTAEQALQHKWLQTVDSVLDRKPSKDVLGDINESILYKDMDSGTDLRKLAIYTIASRASTDEVAHIREVFDHYDTTNNGTISFEEFKTALSEYECTEEQLKGMFRSIGVDENEQIHYTDFIAAILETQDNIDEDRLAEAFDILDCDDTGKISHHNIRTFMGKNHSDDEVKAILSKHDLDGDGHISFREFVHIFRCDERDELLKKCCVSEGALVEGVPG